ncbi:hypothetical protein AB0I28_27295 [Phytomonospora sp. NPDC050363]|uniref:hypothetical protein n=1 Tax=Phytomonospora sp. NPDC050363 TaxID=3155642 RepID=UPI0034109C9B
MHGGHAFGSAIAGKALFPRAWTDATVVEALVDVAKYPDERPRPLSDFDGGEGWICDGVRDGVALRVILEADGSIWTGHPLGGEGVTRNRRNRASGALKVFLALEENLLRSLLPALERAEGTAEQVAFVREEDAAGEWSLTVGALVHTVAATGLELRPRDRADLARLVDLTGAAGGPDRRAMAERYTALLAQTAPAD